MLTAFCKVCGQMICSPELQWSAVTDAEKARLFEAEVRQLGYLVAAHMGVPGHADAEQQMLAAMAAAGQSVAMRYVRSSDARLAPYLWSDTESLPALNSQGATQSG